MSDDALHRLLAARLEQDFDFSDFPSCGAPSDHCAPGDSTSGRLPHWKTGGGAPSLPVRKSSKKKKASSAPPKHVDHGAEQDPPSSRNESAVLVSSKPFAAPKSKRRKKKSATVSKSRAATASATPANSREVPTTPAKSEVGTLLSALLDQAKPHRRKPPSQTSEQPPPQGLTKHQQKKMRKQFFSNKTTDIFEKKVVAPSSSQGNKRKGRGKAGGHSDSDGDGPSRRNFDAAVRDLREIAYPALDKKISKSFERQKLAALGLRDFSKEKTPMHVLREHGANRKVKVKKLQNQDKFHGIQTTVSKHRRAEDAQREREVGMERKKEKKRGHLNYGGVGRESRGMIELSGNYVKSMGRK